MTDYENDLAFKPAMSWEELCEYVESKGGKVYKSPYNDLHRINYKGLSLFRDGSVTFTYESFAENRSYEQMKNIIDNLWGE